jgi:ribosomal protein S18 acetylase RimI-like enzyme
MSEKKEKQFPRAKIELIQAKDVIDVWKLVDKANREFPGHPVMDEDSPDLIRMHLYSYLSAPNTLGVIARIGRRPVGFVLGQLASRPMGLPKQFLLIWSFFVEPEFREKGVPQSLYRELFARSKQAGFHYWEAMVNTKQVDELKKDTGIKGNLLSVLVGGKIERGD